MLGFINVIKPTGVSSAYVVNKIKWLTKEKVGHLGTLDPLASGVLPVAVGKATRFFDYFLNKDKEYFALAKFGIETDTLDSEGKIIKTDNKKINIKDIEKILGELTGVINQMPPNFSAKIVDGQRAYDIARSGGELNLKPKKVQIYNLSVKPWEQENVFAFNIHCSSGTYVRSIVRDVAEKLKTFATTVAIIRKKSGKFCLRQSFSLEEIEKNIQNKLLPINSILNLPEFVLEKEQAKDLFSGKEIDFDKPDGEYLLMYNKCEFAVGICYNKKLKNKIYLYEKEKI